MVQQLRVLAAFPEELSFVLKTHARWFTIAFNFRRPDALFFLPQKKILC